MTDYKRGTTLSLFQSRWEKFKETCSKNKLNPSDVFNELMKDPELIQQIIKKLKKEE